MKKIQTKATFLEGGGGGVPLEYELKGLLGKTRKADVYSLRGSAFSRRGSVSRQKRDKIIQSPDEVREKEAATPRKLVCRFRISHMFSGPRRKIKGNHWSLISDPDTILFK